MSEQPAWWPHLATLSPMLARSAAAVPGPDARGGPYSYEPKWDGFRAIVLRSGDPAGSDGTAGDASVEILSRNGKSMTRYFPDVVAAVRAELTGPLAVDGEIVLVHGDRLDFELLGQRIHPAASRVAMLAEHAPATLVIFDVLAVGDEVLLEAPLSERLAALDALTITGTRVQRTPRTQDADVARRWLGEFEGAGLDGVVAKSLAGPYTPGGRTMTKVKHVRTADVVVAGYRLHKAATPENPLVGSLLLGLYPGDGSGGGGSEDAVAGPLQFVGVVASFSMKRRVELIEELAPLLATSPQDQALHPWRGWADPAAHVGDRLPGATSRWSGGKDLSFVPLRPERVLEVRYDHMEGTRFRHTAQWERWRPDRTPASCTYAQLEEVPGYDLNRILPGAPAARASFTGALE